MRYFLFLQPGMLISKKKTAKNGKELQPLSYSNVLLDKRQVKEKMRSQKWYVCKKRREPFTRLRVKPKCDEELLSFRNQVL